MNVPLDQEMLEGKKSYLHDALPNY
jgi:hypothetical protein